MQWYFLSGVFTNIRQVKSAFPSASVPARSVCVGLPTKAEVMDASVDSTDEHFKFILFFLFF